MDVDQESGPWPRPWKWSREEYYRLTMEGWFPEKRVELIDGQVSVLEPLTEGHCGALCLTFHALSQAFGPNVVVRQRFALNLGLDDFEPDFAVVPGKPGDYQSAPTSALLVVEVALHTLAFDLGRKAKLYARHGVADYWVVDLEGRRLVVHRSPTADGYAAVTEHAVGASVEPLARPGRPVAVNDLLP